MRPARPPLLLAALAAVAVAGRPPAKVGAAAAHWSHPQGVDLPSVTFRDLQQPSGFGRAVVRIALAQLGALEVTDVPGYAAARRASLTQVARCLGGQEGAGLQRLLPDGALRRSLAAKTSASGVLGPLDEEGRAAAAAGCDGAWRGEADHLRLLVRAAALQALAVLREGDAEIDGALGRAEALEHFHLYQPRPAEVPGGSQTVLVTGPPQAAVGGGDADADPDGAGLRVADAVPLHVDAGFLIAATAGLELHVLRGDPAPSAAPQPAGAAAAGPLLLQRADGELVRPRLRQDAVLLMVGHGLAAIAGGRARAMPHAVRFQGSATRAWYGSMLLPAELLLNASAFEVERSVVESLACRGAGQPPAGQQLFEEAQDPLETCSEGMQWCWMQCMPVPAACASESTHCVNLQTGEPWAGGRHMCPDCGVSCEAEAKLQAEPAERPFCLGMGVDMYMDGFRLAGHRNQTCLVYLFPSLVLDTRSKFWAAVVVTFVLALVGPESLRLLHSRSVARAAGDAEESTRQRFGRLLVLKLVNLLCVMHAYVIMLLSMTFSLEIFGAVVLGLALGRRSSGGHEEKGPMQTLCCQVNEALSRTSRSSCSCPCNCNGIPRGLPSSAGSPETATDRTKAELAIGGMTCTTCSGAVERRLLAIPGVESAAVLLLQERATVVFDASRVSATQLCESVDDIGFDAVLLQEAPHTASPKGAPQDGTEAQPQGMLHLEGDAPAEAVRAAAGAGFVDVQQLPAVGRTSIRLLRVIYDPQRVGARTLLSRLQQAGCAVRLPRSPPPVNLFTEGIHAEQHEYQVGMAFQSSWLPAAIAVVVLLTVMSPPDIEFLHSDAFGNALLVVIAAVAGWASFGSRAGRYFLESAAKALQHGAFTMDVLVATSTSVTSVYGLGLTILCLASRPGRTLAELREGAAHFLAMAPVLLLVVLGGKKIELRARQRTAASLKELLAAQPSTALVRLEGGFQEVPLEVLELGDLCRVSAGARFPAEGTVVEGAGAADESLVTGESTAVEKAAGAAPGSTASVCLAGSTLAHGDVVISVTAVGSATTLGRLAGLVARAQGSKPRAQRLADALSARFVPAVLALSVGTVAIWLYLLLSGKVPHSPSQPALQVCMALQFGLSVMMLACPCAMGLATPTAISVAVGVASQRHHCLVRDAAVLESGSSTGRKTAIVLDKTGTITEGRPVVVAAALWAAPGAEMETVRLGLAKPGALLVKWLSAEDADRATTLWTALGASEAAGPLHPVAAAIDRFCESQAPGARAGAEVSPGDLEHLSGRGIRSQVQLDATCRVRLHAGGQSMLPELESEYPGVDWRRLREWAKQQPGATLVFTAAAGGAVAGVLALQDPVRAEAPRAGAALRRAYGPKCEIWICTGDNASAATVAARAMDVPAEQVRSNQLPEDKRALVCTLQAAGTEVIMVGDGLNDAPALAQADLGVAIGAGAQLACDAADVVLCRSSLVDLLAFRELCLATRSTIYRNFAWAFGFNILGLPLAAGAGYPWGVSISPMLAGMAMAGSSVLVVTSSLMLQRFRPSMSEGQPPEGVSSLGRPGRPGSGNRGSGGSGPRLAEPLLAAEGGGP